MEPAEGCAAAKARVQAAYSSMADDYSAWVLDRPFAPGLFAAFVDELSELRGRAGVKVLDLASASGEPAATLAAALGAGATVHATDLTPCMVALGRQRCARLGLANVVCEEADAEALAYPDATFDAATCSMGLMFMPSPDAALAECRRVLKPGGLLVASVYQGIEDQPFYAFLSDLAVAIDSSAQPFDAPQPFDPCRFADPAPLLAAAAAAGLERIECRELSLTYCLSAEHWWAALSHGLPDTPVKQALERAAAKSGGDASGAAAASRELAAGMLRQRGWVQDPDGSLAMPGNMAWLITARRPAEPI